MTVIRWVLWIYTNLPKSATTTVCSSHQAQVKPFWTKRISLNDNTGAMLLYFIQTFPPWVSDQPIADAGQDPGIIKRGRLPPFFLNLYRETCHCVGSFDPRCFISCGGFHWPWNVHFSFHHRCIYVFLQEVKNTHFVTHSLKNQVQEKTRHDQNSGTVPTIFDQQKNFDVRLYLVKSAKNVVFFIGSLM